MGRTLGINPLWAPAPASREGPGTPVPDPLPLWSLHPGCLVEGAQEEEVAASAFDICDGGRVQQPRMQRGKGDSAAGSPPAAP